MISSDQFHNGPKSVIKRAIIVLVAWVSEWLLFPNKWWDGIKLADGSTWAA